MVVYPCNGAEIESISIYTIDGHRINTIQHGIGFDILIVVKAHRNLINFKVGCFIANQDGTRVTGQTIPRHRQEGCKALVGEELSFRFKFQGGLWPGYYFIGAGLSEIDSSEGDFLHRIIDKLVLKVVDIDQVYAIGNTDLTRQN